MSEQFRNALEKLQKNAKSIPLTHKCVTDHLPGFGTGTSIKMAGLKCLQH